MHSAPGKVVTERVFWLGDLPLWSKQVVSPEWIQLMKHIWFILLYAYWWLPNIASFMFLKLAIIVCCHTVFVEVPAESLWIRNASMLLTYSETLFAELCTGVFHIKLTHPWLHESNNYHYVEERACGKTLLFAGRYFWSNPAEWKWCIRKQ